MLFLLILVTVGAVVVLLAYAAYSASRSRLAAFEAATAKCGAVPSTQLPDDACESLKTFPVGYVPSVPSGFSRASKFESFRNAFIALGKGVSPSNHVLNDHIVFFGQLENSLGQFQLHGSRIKFGRSNRLAVDHVVLGSHSYKIGAVGSGVSQMHLKIIEDYCEAFSTHEIDDEVIVFKDWLTVVGPRLSDQEVGGEIIKTVESFCSNCGAFLAKVDHWPRGNR